MADGGQRRRDANQAFSGALLGALARAGVEHVCLCPGSRSTPLAVAAARTPGLTIHAQLDERSAGFFGLGLARASRRPVALVCTSGTAAANFLPAVVEAHWARIPLLVLTADRPAELRGWGAGQTVDQIRLYGSHVRLFVEAPTPAADVDLGPYARALAARAFHTALGPPPGPVHLNLPFREPLEPLRADPGTTIAETGASSRPALDAAHFAVASGTLAPTPALVSEVAAALAAEPNGVIVAGCMDREPRLATAIASLASVLDWPLLAEPISQLRSGPHVKNAPVVAHHDAFLRDARFARAHAPSAVLRFGDSPTSKPLRQWLETDPATRLYLVDPDGVWQDPTHRPGRVLQVDPVMLCESLLGVLPTSDAAPSVQSFRAAFLTADRACARSFEHALTREARLFAPAVVREVAAALPDGASLFVSNSMPVRDVDTFWPVSERRLRVLCNRGANGIDGIVSTALGASCASTGPTLLLTGDLAFLHDVGGLFAARRLGSSCTIVVLHDDGGGIFSFLPIADHGESVRFQELFTLSHGLALGPAAQLYGLSHTRVSDVAALRHALETSVGEPGTRVIEVAIDREANVAHHRELWRAVSAAIEGAEAPS
jgi:2-succinyl-5-enolpyruvyl-6-hydroxy-3-cyclohexene-1-carboxylate synthase